MYELHLYKWHLESPKNKGGWVYISKIENIKNMFYKHNCVFAKYIFQQNTERKWGINWAYGTNMRIDNRFLWTLKSNAVKTDWVKNIYFFLSFFWSFNDSVVSAEAQGFCITVPHTKRKSMQLDLLANINSLISFRYYRRNGLGEI